MTAPPSFTPFGLYANLVQACEQYAKEHFPGMLTVFGR